MYKESIQEDVFHFILHKGNRLRGWLLIKYYLYGLHCFLAKAIVYTLLLAVHYMVIKYTDTKIQLEIIRDVEKITPDCIYTVAVCITAVLISLYLLKFALFVLFAWILNKGCRCTVVELEPKAGGSASIRSISVNGETYNTKIYVQEAAYKKIKKRNNTFVLATDLITRRCIIL